jgi:hypothetical protein
MGATWEGGVVVQGRDKRIFKIFFYVVFFGS